MYFLVHRNKENCEATPIPNDGTGKANGQTTDEDIVVITTEWRQWG
jgi:hypothetical protein